MSHFPGFWFFAVVAPFLNIAMATEPVTGPRITACPSSWYDSRSKLLWQNPRESTEMNWQGAIDYCKHLPLCGYEWRLPEIWELKTLVRGCDRDRCEYRKGPGSERCYWDKSLAEQSPGEVCGKYWSSTTTPNDNDLAYFLNFAYGEEQKDDKSAGESAVAFPPRSARCVRTVSEAEEWPKDPKTGCQVGALLESLASWSGRCEGGKAAGKGTAKFKNGNIYRGEMKAGKYAGQGAFIRTDGASATGEWSDGQPIEATMVYGFSHPKYKTPSAMYVYAEKLEADDNVVLAKLVFQQIAEQFPDSSVAIKASDRLREMRKEREVSQKEEAARKGSVARRKEEAALNDAAAKAAAEESARADSRRQEQMRELAEKQCFATCEQAFITCDSRPGSSRFSCLGYRSTCREYCH